MSLDTKDQFLTPIFKVLDQIYDKMNREDLLVDRKQNCHSLITKCINHLCNTFLLPNISAVLQYRTGIMLAQIVSKTRQKFR